MNQDHHIPMKIGKPASRALVNTGYSSLEQIATLTLSQLKMRGIGPKAVGILAAVMEEKALTL